MTEKLWYIYSLNDPKTKHVRYIGKTVNLQSRYSTHLYKARRRKDDTPVYQWMQALLNQGLYPEMDILEYGNGDQWRGAEKYWIQYFNYWSGSSLLNVTEGGEGLESCIVKICRTCTDVFVADLSSTQYCNTCRFAEVKKIKPIS